MGMKDECSNFKTLFSGYIVNCEGHFNPFFHLFNIQFSIHNSRSQQNVTTLIIEKYT